MHIACKARLYQFRSCRTEPSCHLPGYVVVRFQNIEWNLTTTSVTVSRVNSTYATMAIQGTAVLLQG